ncbi:MAG: VTT domain-containing protein [Chloroflexota bacterium]|nr:VTT domain-containing protein [Chloroflexota bacterium]
MFRWFSKTSDLKIQLIALVLGIFAVSLVFAIWMLVGGLSNSDWWKALGYPGVFFLSLLASGGMVFPIPSLAATCGAAGLDLNLIIVGVLAGLGETLGELVGYSIGFGGQSVVQRRRIYKRARTWMIRWGIGVLLILSIIPNPIFDFVGIAAGALRYPMKRFLITVWVGKTLKGLIIAHVCFWIVEWIRWLA